MFEVKTEAGTEIYRENPLPRILFWVAFALLAFSVYLLPSEKALMAVLLALACVFATTTMEPFTITLVPNENIEEPSAPCPSGTPDCACAPGSCASSK